MFLLSLFVLQLLSGSLCYDEEVANLGNQVLRMWSQPSKFIDMILNLLPSKITGKGKLPGVLNPGVLNPEDHHIIKPMVKKLIMRAISYKEENNTNEVENKVKYNTTDPLKQFMGYLQEKGKKILQNTGILILIDLNIERNITPILEFVTDDYKHLLQNYFEFVKKSQNESERDLLYLDMVETSCRLLYNEEKKLLNDIIMHEVHPAQGQNFQRLSHTLLQLSKRDRKEVMQYVCETYKVCRVYPAFTDYFADLVTEILMLDEKKFRIIIEILSKILNKNKKLFAKIMEKEDLLLITHRLGVLSGKMFAIREFISMSRGVMKQRYKTIKSGNEEFKTKTKATSIMLDIIDKALSSEDDLLAFDFHNSMQAIRSWTVNKRKDIDKHLSELARSYLRKLKHNLSENAVQEMKALIKIIMRGYSKDDAVSWRLFRFGSTYVQGKDFHPDIDIMSI